MKDTQVKIMESYRTQCPTCKGMATMARTNAVTLSGRRLRYYESENPYTEILRLLEATIKQNSHDRYSENVLQQLKKDVEKLEQKNVKE